MLSRIDGLEHGDPGDVDRIRQHHEQHNAAQQRLLRQEPEPVDELPQIRLPLFPQRTGHVPRNTDSDEKGGCRERRRVDEQRVRRPDERHEDAGGRGAEHRRAPLHGGLRAGRPGQQHPPSLGEFGKQHRLGGVPRGVEQAAEEDEQEQQPERQAARQREDGDRQHGEPAGEVGQDARGAVAETVDHRAAQGAADDHRHGREHPGDAGGESGSGRPEHIERNGDHGDRVARLGDEFCGQQPDERGAVRRGLNGRHDRPCQHPAAVGRTRCT